MAAIGEAQLSEWYHAYCDAMVLYARQWLDGSAAEDVVQDVFLRLAGQRGPPENVKAWLFRSVRNAALNVRRSNRRRRTREGSRAADAPAWFEPAAEDVIDARAAQAALESLPPRQHEIVVLRIWAGMTLAQIGETVGEPVSTVHDRYGSALVAMRRILRSSCKMND